MPGSVVEPKESPQTVGAVGGQGASGMGNVCSSNATERSATRCQVNAGKEASGGLGSDAAAAAPYPPPAASALGIVCIRGRIPFPGDVKLYPFGVIGRTSRPSISTKRGKHLENCIRGKIEGLSPAAAARCREFVVTHDIPGARLVSATGTTAIGRTPEEWRKIMQRYAKRLVRAGVAAVWRVELQKRGAPHVHLLIWLPEGLDKWRRLLSEGWLECIGATFHESGEVTGLQPGEFEHSFQCEEGVGAGWVAYLASHSSKHKQEQLGWVGKQWGIWGQERFSKAKPLDVEDLDGPQLARFKRGLRRWQEAKIREERRRRYYLQRRGWEDSAAGRNGWAKGGLQEMVRNQHGALASIRRALRKVTVRPLPCSGTWVRAYAPEVPVRLLSWVRSLNVSNPF